MGKRCSARAESACCSAADFTEILGSLYAQFSRVGVRGKVADYIPALAKVSPMRFGVALHLLGEEPIGFGDWQMRFSIQSVSKLFTFAMAFSQRGETIWGRLGKEPSGAAFNALFQLEAEKGIPRNPFINAGAMVISDMLMSDYDDPMQQLLRFLHELTGDDSIGFDDEVFRSELEYGNRNASLAYLMKSFGNIQHAVPDLLHFYFMQCSITMSCEQLVQAVQFLANRGINPLTRQAVMTASQTKRTNALLLTSGLYNEAGDFAFRVGIPAKSGVGGGIVGVIPDHLAIATWSPGLNELGNSELGIDFLEEFTTQTRLSIF